MGMLVSYGLGAAASIDTSTAASEQNNPSTAGSTYEDELDQSMTHYQGVISIGWYNPAEGYFFNSSVAQTFTPTKEVLTRIQFLMAKNATAAYPCSIAIRESLTGEELAYAQVGPSDFPLFDPLHPENLSWITFDINDIWVNPGQTYYMVLFTMNATDNYYYCAGNGTNMYPNGTVYISYDDGTTWEEIVDADGCFKTYGLRETFFEITQTPGLFGISMAIRNIGNVTAWDVQAGITITMNGIFSKINKTFTVTAGQLAPNESLPFTTGLIFGLGRIHIKIWALAVNVREIAVETDAFLFLFFIIIK